MANMYARFKVGTSLSYNSCGISVDFKDDFWTEILNVLSKTIHTLQLNRVIQILHSNLLAQFTKRKVKQQDYRSTLQYCDTSDKLYNWLHRCKVCFNASIKHYRSHSNRSQITWETVLTFKRAHYSFEKNPETNTHCIHETS